MSKLQTARGLPGCNSAVEALAQNREPKNAGRCDGGEPQHLCAVSSGQSAGGCISVEAESAPSRNGDDKPEVGQGRAVHRASKTCDWCYREKPIAQFSKDASRKDGHATKCKLCCGIYRREVKRIMDAGIRAARAYR